MKLPKVSGKWILPSTMVAVVILMAIWMSMVGWWNFIPWEDRLTVLFLYLILVTACLFFFPTAIYSHGVTNKHSRAIVAARVLGTIGAFAAFHGVRVLVPSPTGILNPFMAIGGVTLAQARPKAAGILMLLAGIMPWIVIGIVWLLVRIGFGELILYRLPLEDIQPTISMLGKSALFVLPTSFVLIPGGAAALASLKEPPLGRWVTLILKIIAILGTIWIIYEFFVLLLGLFIAVVARAFQ
jgi:hypothetical protein